jgi:hypothetical protein
MKDFVFYPELYEHRERAMQVLSENGFEVFADYSSVDPEHELYGLEVGGFYERKDAEKVVYILRAAFPFWRESGLMILNDAPKYWAVICREPMQPTAAGF